MILARQHLARREGGRRGAALARDVLERNRSRADRGGRELTRKRDGKRAATSAAANGIRIVAPRQNETLSVLMHLSHEIRTPLNSMLALSQLLRDGLAGKLNSEQQQYVEVIERNGQNLIRLVNDVLDLSRMESGHVDVEIRSLDVADQLPAIVAALRPLADAKKLALTVDLPRALPAVRCDPERFRQVLTNLVGNAIKFTDRGRVTLAAELAGDMVAVHVSDTGIGIPEKAYPHLFEEFFQVPPNPNAAQVAADPVISPPAAGPLGQRREGAGLGLAIANRLVRLMGGVLSVNSREGEGSRFTFTVPLANDASPQKVQSAQRQQFRDEPHGSNTPGR